MPRTLSGSTSLLLYATQNCSYAKEPADVVAGRVWGLPKPAGTVLQTSSGLTGALQYLGCLCLSLRGCAPICCDFEAGEGAVFARLRGRPIAHGLEPALGRICSLPPAMS